jgi:hypothetical protein
MSEFRQLSEMIGRVRAEMYAATSPATIRRLADQLQTLHEARRAAAKPSPA